MGEDKDISRDEQADQLRTIERTRLRALVEANIKVAQELHSEDFQLINPAGVSISKEQYMGDVASGVVNYIVWEPDAIAVRLYGDAAIIRYQAQLEIIYRGQKAGLRRFWHTDSYEKREGRWQVVWSQATEIL